MMGLLASAVEATMKIAPLAIPVLTTALSLSPNAYAQKAVTDPGKQEFEVNCGVCHGMTHGTREMPILGQPIRG